MSSDKSKYCHQCGAMIPYMDRYCPACHAPQPTLEGMTPIKVDNGKSPWTAVILSFLITGLGQLYLGKRMRAFAFFGFTIIMGLFLTDFFTQEQIMGFGVVMAIISAIDAYRIASRQKQSI